MPWNKNKEFPAKLTHFHQSNPVMTHLNSTKYTANIRCFCTWFINNHELKYFR